MATILLVDDDPVLSRAMRGMLEKDQHHVMQARNGHEAWEQLALHQPELIISDIAMPVMDGWTLLQKLKKHDQYKRIPIIMLSVFDGDDDRMQALQLQADALISKELSFRVIRIQVKKILKANN